MNIRLSQLVLVWFLTLLVQLSALALDPNYTGPSAPTLQLPDIDLPSNRQFKHPGILQSQAEIEQLRSRLSAGEEPWFSAFEAMRKHELCNLTYKPKVVSVINPLDNTVGYLMKDATAAYGHAVIWSLTGDSKHAEKAIEILDANAATLKVIELGPNDAGKLPAGFMGGKFAAAAEIMAHSRQPDGSKADWPPAAQQQFKQMLLSVFYPRIIDFKPEFNGNWDACMIATMMAIGVFCDDHAIFNRGLDYYLHGKGHGSITHYVHAHGQNQESGRDQIHGQMGLGSLAAACEIAMHQGIDLFEAADNRLALGYEHMAKYLSGEEVEITGIVPISPKGRDQFMPIFELAHQHYVIEKGMNLPFLEKVTFKHRPESVDLIVLQSWGTLIHYRGPSDGPRKD